MFLMLVHSSQSLNSQRVDSSWKGGQCVTKGHGILSTTIKTEIVKQSGNWCHLSHKKVSGSFPGPAINPSQHSEIAQGVSIFQAHGRRI